MAVFTELPGETSRARRCRSAPLEPGFQPFAHQTEKRPMSLLVKICGLSTRETLDAALAFVLVIGTPSRFNCGKQVASYLGLIPCEDSSADSWRLGHISKQGNALLRYLLGQAAQTLARCDEKWRGQYVHIAMRRNRAIAKVAMARKLAVRLY